MAKYDGFCTGMMCGGVLGIVLAVLYAPKSGRRLRHEIADVSEQMYRRTAYEIEDLKHRTDAFTANAKINAEPVIHDAQDAMRDAVVTNDESQRILKETKSSLGSSNPNAATYPTNYRKSS